MTQKNFRVRNGLTLDGTTSGEVNIAAPAVAGTQSYTLPTGLPASNGYVLASQTDGTMSWVDNSAAGTTYTIDASSTTGGANFNLQGSDATTDTIKFANGTNVTVSRTDANTITIASTDTNTTYTIASGATTGGANLTLTGSDSSTDSVAYLGSGATTVTSTDANTITISSTDTNTTYTQDATSTTGGANLNLVGSDSTTDSVAYLGSGATTVTRTDANTITISSTDSNTTYDFNATSTTGGANLNLVGSDATTDTVKLTNGGHITATYTSGTEVTLGSDATDANTAGTIVARDGSGNFSASGATLGNVTVGVATDNTISTTTGNLILDSTSGTIIMNSNGTLGVTLTPIAGQTPNAVFNGNMVKGTIRNATTEAGGGVWSYLSGTGVLYKGLSIDNSADDGRGSIAVLRGYAGSSTAKASFIGEVAGGTFATPTAITSGTVLSEFVGNGYTGSNWASDTIGSGLPGMSVTATQTWSSFTSTGSSISGTTLTIGTLTSGTVAAGQMIYGSGITTATSIVSGSGSTWTVDKTQTVGPIAISGGSNGTRLLVRAQTQNTRIGGIVGGGPTGTTPVSIIDHQPTAATYIADAWTFRSRPLNTGGTNTTLLTLDATGNAVLTGDLRVNGNDILSSTGATVMTMNTNDATFADAVQVNGILSARSGLTYDMFTTQVSGSGGTAENILNLIKSDATGAANQGVINFATYRSSGGTYSPTQSGDKIGQFKFNGNSNSGGTPGVPAGPGLSISGVSTELWSSTANGTKMEVFAIKNGTIAPTRIIDHAPTAATYRADTFTVQDSSLADYLVLNSTAATFSKPVKFPVDTAANWNAVTGAVGQQVCVSDSGGGGNPNGMMAFWDTTNARWSYVHDNSAV